MKKIKKILLILILLAIIISYTIYKYKHDESNNYDYTNSIYVKTENVKHDGNDYYEINNDRKIRTTDNFIPDKQETYLFTNCYDSHADIDTGAILNEFKEDRCKENNETTIEGDIRDILTRVSNFVNQITDVTIYKVNNHYYTNVNFTLSTHDSYKFYYYDLNKKKLNHIYTFNDKYVIGVKEKDKLIFEGDKQ